MDGPLELPRLWQAMLCEGWLRQQRDAEQCPLMPRVDVKEGCVSGGMCMREGLERLGAGKRQP